LWREAVDLGAGADRETAEAAAGLNQQAVHAATAARHREGIQPLDGGHQTLQSAPLYPTRTIIARARLRGGEDQAPP
jgi:hypothetical protein